MQDKIIAEIAAYLEENLSAYHDGYADTLGWKRFVPGMIPQIATEIAAAIAPLVEAGDVDWKPKIDDDILVDGKRQAIYRGSAAGLAIVVFRSGMQLTVPFDRISKC